MKDTLLEIDGQAGTKYWLDIEKKKVTLGREDADLYCFRDFTDIVNANKALREKELTLAMSSHELRTPMQGMIGPLEILCGQFKKNREFQLALRSAKLMLNLINDMLDFGSILSNKFISDRATFNLEAVIYEAQSIVDPKHRHSEKIQFRVEFSENVPNGTDIVLINSL